MNASNMFDLSYWGWGDLPDQYGRRWDNDDGGSPEPKRPVRLLADLPPDPALVGIPATRTVTVDAGIGYSAGMYVHVYLAVRTDPYADSRRGGRALSAPPGAGLAISYRLGDPPAAPASVLGGGVTSPSVNESTVDGRSGLGIVRPLLPNERSAGRLFSGHGGGARRHGDGSGSEWSDAVA
jgi:hypothetical protein